MVKTDPGGPTKDGTVSQRIMDRTSQATLEMDAV